MNSQTWQYIAVLAILSAVTVWIIIRLFSKKKRGTSSCCGCALSDSCHKPERREPAKCNDRKLPDCCSKKK